MPNQVKKPRRTPEQQIEALKAKQQAVEDAAKVKRNQLRAQIKAQEARIATAARKEDTHVKIVNGALSFEFFKNNPQLKQQYLEWINNSSEPTETKEKILARL